MIIKTFRRQTCKFGNLQVESSSIYQPSLNLAGQLGYYNYPGIKRTQPRNIDTVMDQGVSGCPKVL